MPINTDFAIGDEIDIAAQAIQQQESLEHLKDLLKELDFNHKIAIAQIACNQIGSTAPTQLIKLKPFEKYFDDQVQEAILLMASLPPKTLGEIAIKILKEVLGAN